MYAIENVNTEPQYNLALEEYLCLQAIRDGSQFFMLWQNEPSIIVGRFQNTLEEINTTFVEERHIHVVRRNSGGGVPRPGKRQLQLRHAGRQRFRL
jgi:lipoate-protein ligase A